jgi:hypothetical protein
MTLSFLLFDSYFFDIEFISFICLFLVKPSASFWNELTAFVMTHNDWYEGDGRSIQEVGAELGLTSALIQRVQQDAFKPDKIAMNVWRAICPTRAARLDVGSIKNVPPSTIRNIYSKLINFIYYQSDNSTYLYISSCQF